MRQNIAPQAVQHAAWTHEVSPRVAMSEDARGVCKVQVSGTITMIAINGNCVFETLNLIARQRLAGIVVGCREMTHDSIDAHVAKLGERVNELAQLIKANSQTSHAGIDFNVNVGDYSGV